MAKIPMQFFILFTGAMVFVFYTFTQPPVMFNARSAQGTAVDTPTSPRHRAEASEAPGNSVVSAARDVALPSRDESSPRQNFGDANQAARMPPAKRSPESTMRITSFSRFVTHHLPAGFVGLIMAAIFAAAMSTISARGQLACDGQRHRHLPAATSSETHSDRHYLRASQLFTAFWCGYAILYGALWGRPRIVDRSREPDRISVL